MEGGRNRFEKLAEKSFHPPLFIWVGGMIVARLHWLRFLLGISLLREHEVGCRGRVVNTDAPFFGPFSSLLPFIGSVDFLGVFVCLV